MKSFLSLLALFFLVMNSPASETPVPSPTLTAFFQKLKSGEKLTVVAYGTSLTYGGQWARELGKWFQQKFPGQVTLVNSGGPGQNSDWGVKNLEAKVLTNHPALVVVEFSYNDAVTRFNLSVEHCKTNLDTIVQGILKQNPDAAIVLQTMNAPWDSPKKDGSPSALQSRPNIDAYNDNYRVYAKEYGLPLVDNYPDYLKIRETEPEKYHKWLSDGSHPNAEASLAITWPNIRALLEAAAK
jgi:acyl-CoA thioesterase I